MSYNIWKQKDWRNDKIFENISTIFLNDIKIHLYLLSIIIIIFIFIIRRFILLKS